MAFRFALIHFKPSGGNIGDSASELRAIDKRLEKEKGGAINKATIAQRYGKAYPGEHRRAIKPDAGKLANTG